MAASRVLLTTLLSLVVVSTINAHQDKKLPTGRVTYDGRSLMINGKRVLLFSGSVHYTRSTPDMWPDILQKAKKGGLNLIQTYVFWNVHEPVQGQYNFTGQYDLVKFIKLVWKHDMYVTLRLGPFIQAEWNNGGLPYWMREVPDITFRTDNGPFKHYMEKYVRMITEKMKAEKLFAPQGGPIILAQIENEYNHIQRAFRERGSSYVQWAAKLALGMKIGVPWIMCKQTDAPDPVINSCNGRHCGDTFTGPNKPYKPALWTENWTAQYRAFGDPPSQRSAEDISYSVARFFSRNGTMANYYMYHGGTNFGRTSAHFTTTRYYDEAPLDEYGLQREPKWGHLKDLHRALHLCKKALLWGGVRGSQILGKDLEATFFEQPGTNICAAFLVNNNTKIPQTVNFKGENYIIPPRSISILPDCKTVVYNTDTIVAQHNSRNFVRSEIANRNLKWKMYTEVIPSQFSLKSIRPFELFGLTKDTTDYAWYSTGFELDRVDLSVRKDIAPVIRIPSLGHAMIVFVNGEYLGSAHGNHDVKGFVFQDKIKLKPGFNQITLLCSTMGFPDSGPYMERVYTGPRAVQLLGLNTGNLDLTFNGWGHQVGLDGEKLGLFSKEGSKKVEWTKANGVGVGVGPPLTWYKASFDAPEGKNPVVIRMTGMGKGLVWVNGKSIGRHWMSFLSALGKPSQSEYHIPRAYIKPKDNLLVVFEEKEADPKTIEILVVDRDTICSFMTELHPPHVRSWARQNSHIRPVVDIVRPAAHLKCPNHKTILAVEFASWGDPYGACGNYFVGNCSSPISKEVIEKRCLGRTECEIPIERKLLDKKNDGCPDITKTLAVQVKCGYNKH